MHYNFDTLFDRRATECYKWNYYPDDVLPLPVADMDFISPQPVIDALQHRVSHGIFGYPEWSNPKSSTLICLYEVIVERMQRLYGWEVKPEELVFFPGVVAGLNLACSALSGSDIGVLIQPPVYPPFLHLADNAGAFLQEAQLALRPDGSYEIDWNAFEAAFTPQTKIFVLCNPHNPVGRVFRKDELERMASLCLEHGVTILSDEIHCDLLFSGQNHIPIASLNPEIAQNAITLMAPSKTFNLAGLFCSFAVIQNPELRQRFRKVQESRSAAVNVLGLVAAEAAYSQGQEWLDQLLPYLQANRDFLFDYVNQRLPGVRMASPEGTYLAWLDCRAANLPDGKTPFEFFLHKARVALQEGKAFGAGGDGFVRLNFGCPRATLVEALQRMEKALAGL
jgi:cysteine-S-conjugate beta-lyase